jgi:2-dehydropantoate 2-reductase
MAAMRVLVVGAGAVGQVFAKHLMRGGAEVAWLVKPKHAAAARAGFAVHRHGCGGVKSETVRAGVVTDAGPAAWDAVLLCVPSTALAAPHDAWLRELALATGDATIVSFGPGLGDAAKVAAVCGAERTVAGGIALMAWASPLAGEDAPPGTSYWLPPLAACPFTGPRAKSIVNMFKNGGLRAAVNRDAVGVSMTGAAVLETTAAALRVSGWSRRALARDRALRRIAADAAREAIAIASIVRGVKAPAAARMIGPRTTRAILGGLARLAPMDVDRFFEAHYGKLAEQSKAGFASWAARAGEHGLPHGAIDALGARVAEVMRAA